MSTSRQATWPRPGYNTGERYSGSEAGRGDGGSGSGLGSTMVGMMMLPWNMFVSSMRAMTDATQSMTNMTGGGHNSQAGQTNTQSSWTGGSSGGSSGGSLFGGRGGDSGTGGGLTGTVNQMLVDTDLSGDDLKYVTYCIVSTKPGFETVIKPQREEIVNYATDGSTYAALKIARCLDDIRQGKVERPEGWAGDSHDRSATTSEHVSSAHTDYAQGTHTSQTQTTQSTWRIEPHDEKYLQVLFKVERRLPKRTEYREEVTVRTTTNTSSIS